MLASFARTNTHKAYSTKFIKLNSVNLYVYLKSRFWFLDAGEDRCATVTAVQIETRKLMLEGLALPEFYLPLTKLLRVLLWQRNSQYILITLYSRSPNTRTRLAEKQTSVKWSDEHLTRLGILREAPGMLPSNVNRTCLFRSQAFTIVVKIAQKQNKVVNLKRLWILII